MPRRNSIKPLPKGSNPFFRNQYTRVAIYFPPISGIRHGAQRADDFGEGGSSANSEKRTRKERKDERERERKRTHCFIEIVGQEKGWTGKKEKRLLPSGFSKEEIGGAGMGWGTRPTVVWTWSIVICLNREGRKSGKQISWTIEK